MRKYELILVMLLAFFPRKWIVLYNICVATVENNNKIIMGLIKGRHRFVNP
jgi:hypothetical protein